jgi:ligand-binding sensor domain-containing protein
LTIGFTSCNGQVKTDFSKDSLLRLKKNHLIPQFPDENCFVQCGLQDKAGNMWFGSAGDGIYYYDGKSFANFTRTDDLNLNDILCCMEDKSGIIWFGTRRGLIRYKPSGKKPEKNDFTSFLIAANIIDKATQKKLPYTFKPGENFVWSIMQNNNGEIWFGTNKGICTYNPTINKSDETPSFTNFSDNDNLVNGNHLHLIEVTSMLQDRNGNIWFVSGWNKGEGIYRYDGKSLTNYKPDSINSFRKIIERRNGDLLFLSAFIGVYSYDGKTFTNISKKMGIKNDTLVAMTEDKAGNLWFGQSSSNMINGGGGGVWRYDGKSMTHFTTKDGLSHNCVFCIVEDKDDNIWFGTRNTGLCRFDGKTFTDYTE